jgi:hypothetical protein
MNALLRYLLPFLLPVIAAIPPAAAQDLGYYDPTGQDGPFPVPTAPVQINVQPSQPLLTIYSRFYGVNIHPGSAQYELANKPLLQKLKPDSIRVMTRMRLDWPPQGMVSHLLSPAPGVFDWTQLDLLLQGIVDVGAEPFLTLGFGPPHFLTQGGTELARVPPAPDLIEDYATYMSMIVQHYVNDKKLPVRLVSVDNEPENVRYPINDYIKLFKAAKTKIKAIAPNVLVGGPAIGFADWPQPDGTSLPFGESLNMLKAANTPFDFLDWHIYSTKASTVIFTVNAVRRRFSVPLIMSEVNRDWRYSGVAKEESKQNNTGWESASWLAYVYDQLQRLGVGRVYYFAWRENVLGLVDAKITTLRPNYYVFWAMTNQLSRKRVVADSSDLGVGCIATYDGGRFAALIYNRTAGEVRLKINGLPVSTVSAVEFSKSWYDTAGYALPFKLPTVATLQPEGKEIPLSAGGILLLKSGTF